jgi:hypothetical protein
MVLYLGAVKYHLAHRALDAGSGPVELRLPRPQIAGIIVPHGPCRKGLAVDGAQVVQMSIHS